MKISYVALCNFIAGAGWRRVDEVSCEGIYYEYFLTPAGGIILVVSKEENEKVIFIQRLVDTTQ